MRRKIFLLLLVVSLVVVGANSGGFRGVLGWFALAYVLWRAFPGIVTDVRRLARGASLRSLLRPRGARANTTL